MSNSFQNYNLIRRNISALPKILAKASMRNTNFKKYAGLFRREPNVANWIRLRRATSNAHVFNKISYAGLSKWSQRGGLENRLPNRHGGSNPSACAKKTPTFRLVFFYFLYQICVRSQRVRSEKQLITVFHERSQQSKELAKRVHRTTINDYAT